MRNNPRGRRSASSRRQRPPARSSRAIRAELAALLEQPRFEVLPTARTRDLVAAHLRPGRLVAVTASPTRGLEDTVALSTELADLGYDVVPHLAARLVIDASHLADTVERLRASGVTRVFVPSGDGDPQGCYPDALALLEGLAALGSPFTHVGITGYPESHPSIPDDLTVQSMWDKRRHATEMVSNLTFDPDVVATWLARVRGRGVTLPLWLGIPGPVDATRLLRIASRVGVGDSTRFLLKHRRVMTRMAIPGGFSSETFLRRLAPTLTHPDSVVAGLHVFTFNQVAETEAWRAAVLGRLQEGGVHPVAHRRGRPVTTH